MDIMKTTTMTDQLKLTLASGVVHGLKCRVKGESEVGEIVGYDKGNDLVTIKYNNDRFMAFASDIELLMHPTSKLTEPILPDGKIPIVELAKMAFPEYEWYLDKRDGGFAYTEKGTMTFYFENGAFYAFRKTNQLALFDQLDAWHINYRGVEAVEID